ncbi:hypothetical protein [Thioalkalivibrio sp. ALJT]|uniref:hypothetical protein n=1 Tax=Thioalkalivibrio sp. ALJT TaxID=1158146 RepID=UPI0003720D84
MLMVLLAGCAVQSGAPEAADVPADREPAPTAFASQAVPTLAPAATPGAAVLGWLASTRWASGLAVDYSGLVIDQPRPERAELRLTGLRDDAVSAYEFRLELDATEAGWVVVAIERRAICRRGLGESGLCL